MGGIGESLVLILHLWIQNSGLISFVDASMLTNHRWMILWTWRKSRLFSMKFPFYFGLCCVCTVEPVLSGHPRGMAK